MTRRDPADVAQEDGTEAIEKVIESARPLLEFKLEQTIDKLPLDTPEARSRAGRDRERTRLRAGQPATAIGALAAAASCPHFP